MNTKSAMISIVGRPNVGKSTLTNRLVGEKISIVSPKPQTTRTRIFGVYSDGDTQISLLDTPGLIRPKNRLGDYMTRVIKSSAFDVDAAILVIKPVCEVGVQEEKLIDLIKKSKVPSILAINMIDTIRHQQILEIIKTYSDFFSFDHVIPISAKVGTGVDTLRALICNYAKPGPWLFPEGMTTNQPEAYIISEIIREKLLIILDKEIPHGTMVEITKFSERDTAKGAIIDVEATIICEKKTHKGIIIGKGGAVLKRVGQYAREDIERFMGVKVNLQTWVKVKENWRNSISVIKSMGYE